MKPLIGWTMLSREEMNRVERSLANNEQDTRDEIGFLMIHQGFADRFFPGTSVLHTRIRYALFIPWLYQRAARMAHRGVDPDSIITRLLIELAKRLKTLGGEPYDVIGGDKLGQLNSQPPDRVYWTALRTWKLLLPNVDSRSSAVRRLRANAKPMSFDDDGGRLDDDPIEVFAGLPPVPDGWNEPSSPLRFAMPRHEREFLREKLALLMRPGDDKPSLLAKLVMAGDTFPSESPNLPKELNARADGADKVALGVARNAAALAAIGRAVYGALVEQMRAVDGVEDVTNFREQLEAHLVTHGEEAGKCDLDALEALLPELPGHVRQVLRETKSFALGGKPGEFLQLHDCYRRAEVIRKTGARSRLIETGRQRRAEWEPGRHNTTPLHYRWHIVRTMLRDLGASR
jgi:hypothetical protein